MIMMMVDHDHDDHVGHDHHDDHVDHVDHVDHNKALVERNSTMSWIRMGRCSMSLRAPRNIASTLPLSAGIHLIQSYNYDIVNDDNDNGGNGNDNEN